MSPLALQLHEQTWSGLANKVDRSVWTPSLNKMRELLAIHILYELPKSNLPHALLERNIKHNITFEMREFKFDK